MHKPSELSSYSLNVTITAQFTVKPVQSSLPIVESKVDTPRFLITLDKGIGDTAIVGLSAIDQIIESMKLAGQGFDPTSDRVDIPSAGLRELRAGDIGGGLAIGIACEEIQIDGVLRDSGGGGINA